jgi:hypothetical protein
VSARVTARHPAEELAVVDDKVAEGELVRVEHEGSDAEGENRDPEVDDCERQGEDCGEWREGRENVL